MKIRDIVNRDIVNLTNCENEPIHIPGSIQPHGLLIGLTKEYKIAFCSENISTYLSFKYAEVLGKDFKDVFGDENFDIIKGSSLNANVLQVKMELEKKMFQCFFHQSNDYYVFEAEPCDVKIESVTDVYNQTLQFINYMNTTQSLKSLCQMVASETRSLTGYDRVMVYRFDKEYNGEVFAECCREDLEPFLGLYYPHTDIPVQARELYMRNVLRLITDMDYTPVPIYTIDDDKDKNLDLSLSILRSTSPIHVEYLKNMGVGATLTISLIHQGKLWGLIACHHYSSKNITPEIRLAAQLQGQFITSQIDVRQSNEEYEVSRKTNNALEKVTGLDLPPIMESFKIISVSPELLKLCNASGVSLYINGEVYKNGVTPPASVIPSLSDWLFDHSNDSSFITDKIIDFIPTMKSVWDKISGVVYHSLGKNNSIIWYRTETIIEVNWGGDPNKAIVKDENGLHPRNSFAKWKQISKNRSTPWLHPELNVAAKYAHALQKQINLMLLSDEEIKYRKLSEKLKESNEELQNINWISTHDLQEPLRKIQVISSMMLFKEKDSMSDNMIDSLDRVSKSAMRMQNLLSDILKYTRIKNADKAFELVDMNEILKEVLLDIKDNIIDTEAEIVSSDLPSVYVVPFLMKQLISNILLNSLKYSSPDRKPLIAISVEKEVKDVNYGDSTYFKFVFEDNGIGFDQEYAESIFNIFTRLHSQNEYMGSGVGLALCKKIIQAHNGYISAKSSPDKGAVFMVYLPFQDDLKQN
ncbi:ATP-binding protein [Flavobacterium seoulense]|uniref:histidine kinase n=1 Tax=Flavobacterium seoulense TaxID=1492738 RepID=A0A066WYE3_9FLAO|nr:ATP-binding protein [Flavobacterium seoulense]KDN55939.1 histidine kinase [Flavobacterium seoulense]